jgi:hypothetical protein
MTEPTQYPTVEGHDYDSDSSKANLLRTTVMMHSLPRCSLCVESRILVPMPGDGWGFASEHERHCPKHEDNHEATEVHLDDLYDGQDRVTAEALWSLPAADDGQDGMR